MQIIPIKELRDTGKISDICNQTNEPIFITKNGYGDMVVMSLRAYEERIARLEMLEAVMEGKRQADSGQIIDGPAALTKFRERCNNGK